jgi:crotonobetainyl-CoA:carnitine CoA-transferase CaiB-like acyl-CoA transferase
MSRGTHTQHTAGNRPLHGIRVLDFTRVLSGPHATRMLADMGAQVIKVEPPEGDLTRFAQPRINSLSSYFIQQNVGKLNISVDLSKPAAAELIMKILPFCDVVIENSFVATGAIVDDGAKIGSTFVTKEENLPIPA